MGLRPAKLHEKLTGQMWRTQSCVQRRHSCVCPLASAQSVE
jgi:hypothetical protein